MNTGCVCVYVYIPSCSTGHWIPDSKQFSRFFCFNSILLLLIRLCQSARTNCIPAALFMAMATLMGYTHTHAQTRNNMALALEQFSCKWLILQWQIHASWCANTMPEGQWQKKWGVMRNTIFVAGDEGIFWALNLPTQYPHTSGRNTKETMSSIVSGSFWARESSGRNWIRVFAAVGQNFDIYIWKAA